MIWSRVPLIALIFMVILRPLPVFACAVCGCSEVCPLTMTKATNPADEEQLLTSSIWGNMILKMAYAHDELLGRLAKKRRHVNSSTVGVFAGVAAGTAGQGIVGMGVLNPPEGHEDSYVPGTIGLCLEGVVNCAITGNFLLTYKYNKKIKEREAEIRERAENVLEQLSHQDSGLDHANAELVELIGRQGAQEYLQLWDSSHKLASKDPLLSPGLTISSSNNQKTLTTFGDHK